MVHALLASAAALPLAPRFGLPLAPFGLACLSLGLIACAALWSRWTAPLARRRVALSIAALGVLAVGALDLGLYPRSRTGPAPSTAPDALIEPMQRLMRGDYPYAVELRGQAPASPGLGWVVLNAPLTLSGLIPLLSAIWLGLAAAMLARSSAFAAAAFVILSLANLHFLRLGIVGHDLFPAVCGLVAVLAALIVEPPRISARLGALAVAAGVVATARVPFALFLLVVAFLLARRERSSGLFFGAVSLGVAGVLHGAAIAWGAASGAWYQPLHVFGRAGRGGTAFLAAGAVLWSIAAVYVMTRRPGRAPDWFARTWLVFATPFVLVGIGELAAASWSIAGWEAANYLAFSLPLLAASLALGASRRAAAPSPASAPASGCW